MATGSASVIGSTVEDPPLPGFRGPKEYVTACFTASGASVASVSYSFNASFGSTPSVWSGGGGGHGGSVTASLGNVMASNLSSGGVSFYALSNDAANASFETKTTFLFSE